MHVVWVEVPLKIKWFKKSLETRAFHVHNDNTFIRALITNKYLNPHLSSRFAAAKLPPLLEAGVPVCPDDAVVQPRAINEAHGMFRACTHVVSGTAGVKVCGRLLNLHNMHTSYLN